MIEQPDIKTLCYIEGQRPSHGGRHTGCGVFISPRRVLTAWHVVAGSKELTFKNSDGYSTQMKAKSEGARHFKQEDLDLAVVELRGPIGQEIAIPQGPEQPSFEVGRLKSAWLATMYDGKPACYKAKYDPLYHLMSEKGKAGVTFTAEIQAIPGYSGSPIFAADGISLVSITTHVYPKDQQEAINVSEVFQRTFGGINIGIPFCGPHPEAFNEWLQSVNKSL
jgi:hypothetical protein